MKNSYLSQISAREILDSRGNPTVEVEVLLDDGSVGTAAVPSGASTGSKEALELRDGGKRYLGKGVRKAVAKVNQEVAPAITGLSSRDFYAIDNTIIALDGTSNKSNFGANAILGISLACARAIATSNGINLFTYINLLMGNPTTRLPTPMMNLINGGVHADNSLDIQEFMIQPIGAPTIAEAIRCGAEIFHHLKALLRAHKLVSAVGDEGGFAPDLPNTSIALELLSEATNNAGYELGKDITFALDCAASEMYKDGEYHIEGKRLDSHAMADFLAKLCEDYPIASIEDGLDENDYEGWKYLTKKIGKKVQLVGDDLFVTDSKLLKQGMTDNMANAILIKLNQIGSLTETINCIVTAHTGDYQTIISHRSGETEDTFIADLAVGSGSSQIKTGSLCRSERVAKYNQLLRIASSMPSLSYAGRRFLQKGFVS